MEENIFGWDINSALGKELIPRVSTGEILTPYQQLIVSIRRLMRVSVIVGCKIHNLKLGRENENYRSTFLI